MKILNWSSVLLLGVAIQAHASGVLNPDETYPVSRFGVSEVGGYSFEGGRGEGGRGPASANAGQNGQNDEELRGRDEITLQRASSVTSSPKGEPGVPLGTLRRNGVQEVAVIAGDLGFFPRTVFVTRDVPVRMFVTGASKNSLCMLMDSFQVRKQIKSQKIEEVSFTPNQPGRFRFYCPINGAEGFVVVREFERGDGG